MAYFKLDIDKFPKTTPENARHQFQGLAHLAELAYRYDDMCAFMKEVVKASEGGPDLTADERNLLSVAYKNAVGARRAAWRSLNMDESCLPTDRLQQPPGAQFRRQVEDELESLCLEILDLLESVLTVHPLATEDSMVFYRKMAGDYYRYLAEFVQNDNLKLYQIKSSKYYKDAMEIATSIMSPADPIRLGLALNYSVCLYEIMRERQKACELAKNAFEMALVRLDSADPQQYKDSRLILNLLRDNLALWSTPGEGNGAA